MKLLKLIVSLLIVLGLSACTMQDDPVLTDDEALIAFVASDIEAILPLYVNESFYFPTYNDVTIEWTIDEEIVQHRFIYEAPFLMEPRTITATIKTKNVEETFEYPVVILPLDSPLNNNVIRIQSLTDYEDVLRNTYSNASISVTSHINGRDSEVLTNKFVELRGRGNSTWFGVPKRPFRLKFQEEVALLGLPETTDYVLLAEHADKSLMRNMITFKLSSLLEHIEYTPSARYVEVYYNDEYLGLYLLTNQVEVSDNYIDIPEDLSREDAGFMLELDHRFFQEGRVDGVDGFIVSGIPYVIDQPSPGEGLNENQLTYIKDYITNLQVALRDNENYEAYIDIDNFIDYFIVQELVKNVDVGWGSVFSYKRTGEVLKLGPLWDFDLAYGNADYIDYGPVNWYGMRIYKNYWFRLMMDVPEIRLMYRERYNEIYEEIVPLILSAIEEIGTSLEPYAERNFERWETLDIYVWPNPPEVLAANTHAKQVEVLYDFIRLRSNWMYHEMQTLDYQNGQFDD